MDARSQARHAQERRAQLQELNSSLSRQVASLRAELLASRGQPVGGAAAAAS
jgi:hypothetical protein